MQASSPAEPQSPPAPPQSRVRLIDGMRGLAALMVAMGHVCVLSPARHVTAYGHLGVPVFFVISGFVIANSLRDAKITPKFCGLYALRRSIRLDPPCWFAILVSVGYGYWLGFFDSDTGAAPTFKLVLAHLFYLQGLLRYPNLNPVLWTLCLEVQFYASYLLLQGLAQRLSISVYWPVLALGCASLCFSVSGRGSDQTRFVLIDPHRSLFPIFSMFAIGIVLWLQHAKLIPSYLCALWIGIFCLRVMFWREPDMYAALAAGFIIFVGLRWKLVLIENPVLMFLGRISYSLYLIHYNVSATFLILAAQASRTAVEFSLWWCLAAVGVAILAAWGMNVLIERPALRLSKKVAPRREREKEAPVPIATGNVF